VVNVYSIYATDIRTKGFKVIEFDDYITEKTVKAAMEILDDPQLEASTCEYNYQVALRHFSYRTLRNKLSALLTHAFGMNE
jgi:hypothetical protein